ncbi:hypothetical protein BANRA_04096 [Acinetobacter baumannii]|nr:hypothetical protein BANRA_04096 [Acinetobacter baumannii]
MSSLLGDLNAVDSSLTSANLNANNNSDRTILKLPLNRVKLDPQNVRLEYDQDYVKNWQILFCEMVYFSLFQLEPILIVLVNILLIWAIIVI